jgi:ribonuclease H-related protein
MASQKKHYAVKSGRNPLTDEQVHDVILDSWAETFPLVHGVPGAVYAGFVAKADAEAWLADTREDPIFGKSVRTVSSKKIEPTTSKGTKAVPANATGSLPSKAATPEGISDCPPDTLFCYVDGSFNDAVPNYSFGMVCVCNGAIVHSAGGAGKNAEAVSMRQIAGELLGAMQALVFARRQGYAEVVILHDYKGVSMHAEGTWKRTNPFSCTYYDWMQAFFRDNPGMSVKFRKVDAHSGNRYNELADVLAKTAVGMAPDPAYLKMAQTLGLLAAPDADGQDKA